MAVVLRCEGTTIPWRKTDASGFCQSLLAATPCMGRSAGLHLSVMPALKELAPLLTELTALRARVEELLAENAAPRAQVDQLARDSKRQAAPFPKGQRKAQPRRPGREPGHG